MSSKKISDLSAGTRMKVGDLFEASQLVTAVETSLKLTAQLIDPSPILPPATAGAVDDEFDVGSLGGSYVWVNQNGSTATFANSKLCLIKAAQETPLTILYVPISSTWTITGRFWTNSGTTTNGFVGMAIGDSSTGKYHIFLFSAGGSSFAVQNWTDFSTFSSQPASVPIYARAAEWFMRIQRDGTNLTFSFSFDGSFFTQVYQVARATWLTGGQDRIGFMLRPIDTNGLNLICDYLRQTA